MIQTQHGFGAARSAATAPDPPLQVPRPALTQRSTLCAPPLWPSPPPAAAAPGVGILSTVFDSDTSYDFYTGTSMATPIVVGAAALL